MLGANITWLSLDERERESAFEEYIVELKVGRAGAGHSGRLTLAVRAATREGRATTKTQGGDGQV